MKKLCKVSFYAEMDEDDIGAIKESLADVMEEEMHIEVIGLIEIVSFTDVKTRYANIVTKTNAANIVKVSTLAKIVTFLVKWN